MSGSFLSQHGLAVRQGPRFGHAPSVVVALCQSGIELPPNLFEEVEHAISEVPRAQELIAGPPRRGKRRSRKLVIMTIKFARGTHGRAALKSVKRALAALGERIKMRPERRLAKRALQLERKRVNQVRRGGEALERWLDGALG